MNALKCVIKVNHKYGGWWSIYDEDGNPIYSSTSHLSIAAHLDSLIKDQIDKQSLDLQCEAEELHHK